MIKNLKSYSFSTINLRNDKEFSNHLKHVLMLLTQWPAEKNIVHLWPPSLQCSIGLV